MPNRYRTRASPGKRGSVTACKKASKLKGAHVTLTLARAAFAAALDPGRPGETLAALAERGDARVDSEHKDDPKLPGKLDRYLIEACRSKMGACVAGYPGDAKSDAVDRFFVQLRAALRGTQKRDSALCDYRRRLSSTGNLEGILLDKLVNAKQKEMKDDPEFSDDTKFGPTIVRRLGLRIAFRLKKAKKK